MKYLLVLLFSCNCFAYEDYEVDWPERGPKDKGYHVLAVTVDGCETRFRIKDEDFYDATENDKALTESVEKAIKRAHSGCKN